LDLKKIRLDNLDFDKWLDVIFKQAELSALPESAVKLEYSNRDEQLSYLIKLFNDPEILLKRFQVEVVYKGLNMFLDSYSMYLYSLIFKKENNGKLENRIECIKSIKNLFEIIFVKDSFSQLAFMWWDEIITAAYPHGTKEFSKEDMKIREAIFVTLNSILNIENTICQASALHGLGHLQHPGTKEVIENYLNRSNNLNNKFIRYAKLAIEEKMDPANPLL
jgi:hypothetical protein